MNVTQRSIRANIWKGLHSATTQEIADGLDFYPGAHGLCRFFSMLHPDVSTRHVAGIYAALSPLNTWDTNVANILDVLRDWSAASVNTTDVNLHKALRIRCGEDPDQVLVGPKVRAFFRAIADPEDREPIAVDRHLINLALGIVPDKAAQSKLANDRGLYAKIEAVYTEMGRREGLGNRLASIAWFVQRRIQRDGQYPIRHERPVCCGRSMWLHGPDRFYCSRCRSTQVPEHRLRLYRDNSGEWIIAPSTEGYPVFHDSKGRACITINKRHPYATSAGYQRLARFIVAESIGRELRPDEHIHHLNGDLTDDRPSNLALVSAEYHGRVHGSALFVARHRDGRFVELEQSESRYSSWPRHGAILGTQARHT